MNIKVVLISLAIGLSLISIYVAHSSKSNLIPREVLFGNPVKARPRISPDGTKISYIAPVNNVLNVFVGDLTENGVANARPVTSDTHRGIRSYFWSPTGKQILYLQDVDGDENWELYSVNLLNQEVTRFTPTNVQTNINAVSKHHPDEILIAMNQENPKEHDIYKLTLSTGKLEMIAKNPGGVVAFVADKDFKVRAALKLLDDGSRQLLLKSNKEEWEPAITWQLDDVGLSGPISFALDPRFIYLEDSRDANTSRFVKYDSKTRATEVVLEDPYYDVGTVLFDDDTLQPKAAVIQRDKAEWVILDANFEKTFNSMRALDVGEMSILGSDNDNKIYILGFIKDNGPVAFYVYDTTKQKATYLFSSKPELEKYKLASMEPISFTSRDGLTVHGYLTLPVDTEPKNLPLVVNVHGGPWLRDSWGYDAEAQWLANRGYAVLQVNYRGSTGYGKKFLNAGNKEWGAKMLDDLIDGATWAVNKGIVNPKRIAIYGGSYGGYAALAGATFTPDFFRCVVDVVGISNLLTFMKSFPPYWEVFKQEVYRRVGNLETEEEFLKSRSPLFHVDKIKIPMLIAQGANDPRVKQAESEQIVEVLKEKGIDYEYLLFKDEGHGFVRPENRLKFYKAAEKFLARCLGGRYES